jgi:major type 1 subunit fimbrin (pilin)
MRQPVSLFSWLILQNSPSAYIPSQQYPLTSGTTVNDLEFGARYIQTGCAITGWPG